MKLETIVKAALNDMERGKAKPHCGNPARNDDEPLNGIEWSHEYAEPGYDKPKYGILFANWNEYPTRLTDILEKAGYAIEWSDEWSTCGGCNRAVRTSPDSYGWRQSYVIYDDCELLCVDCVKDDLDSYEEYLLNKSNTADTFDIDWQSRGFEKFNAKHYENGFHAHQNDKPKEIVKHLPKGHDFLFAIPSVGQFDVSFDCWIRKQEQDDDEN